MMNEIICVIEFVVKVDYVFVVSIKVIGMACFGLLK